MSNNDQEKTPATESTLNRRAFVKGAGFTGLGLAGATLVAGLNPSAAHAAVMNSVSSGITDIDILNFALNLEYLEAEFYTMAVTGKTLEQSGIPITGTGKPGPTTGGSQVTFSPEDGNYNYDDERSGLLVQIAPEIMSNEQTHVLDLRAALGNQAVAKPAINLNAAGIGFADFRSFLKLSRAFEDVGVSAYGGAAPLITTNAYLAEAVRIGLTEAYHASLIRGLIAANSVMTTAVDQYDVLPPPSGNHYFLVNAQAITIVRTTSEVLAIAYANQAPGTKSGGFFPNGVNGKINTV